jgi:hypothetical protein
MGIYPYSNNENNVIKLKEIISNIQCRTPNDEAKTSVFDIQNSVLVINLPFCFS